MESNKDQIEKIKVRIAQLRKHSESAKNLGSLAEAEAFAMKANELLLEYNLKESEIDMSDDKDKFKKWGYSERLSFKCNQSGQRAKLKLVSVLCKHNLCQYIQDPYDKTFEVFGNMENVDNLVWMYNFLSVGLLRLAQESHVALSPMTKQMYNRYAYLKDFLLGAATGIDHKLTTQTAANAQVNQILAMIKVNKDDLDLYMSKTRSTKKTKMKAIKVGFGYGEGVKAGENFNITKPLGSAPTKSSIDNTICLLALRPGTTFETEQNQDDD